MKHACNDHERHLMQILCHLPRKIILVHERSNVPMFVLHELCHHDSFDLSQAAFFVDNPDFDCLQGIAGYAQCDIEKEYDIWIDPDVFTKDMEHSTINNKVRCICKKSCAKNQKSVDDIAQEIGKELGFSDIGYCVWPMKHDNRGLLVYEVQNQDEVNSHQEHLDNGAHILSFCPVH